MSDEKTKKEEFTNDDATTASAPGTDLTITTFEGTDFKMGEGDVIIRLGGVDGREMVRFKSNGDIFVKGKLVENDDHVVDGFRELLSICGARRWDGPRALRRLIIHGKFNARDCGDCDYCGGPNDEDNVCGLFDVKLTPSPEKGASPLRDECCLQYDEDPEVRKLAEPAP